MENKRKHKRLPIELRVELILSGEDTFFCRTENISFGGTYVFCEKLADTPKREPCRIRLLLGADSEQPIEIDSRIVRADALGVGIEFLAIDIADYQRFEKIMVYNSPDAIELMAELDLNPGMTIIPVDDK